MLAVTGDTHGKEKRFLDENNPISRCLREGDYLFICGDFGYIFYDNLREKEFLDFLAEKPFVICWIDGNHENFDVINSYPIEQWCSGNVHIIRRNKEGIPKIIHLMRGQVYEIENKKIFTFGGAYSVDKATKMLHKKWWPEEMFTEEEREEAMRNLQRHQFKVDYILTHTAPEETMSIFHPDHEHEKPLNNFFELIRECVKYEHWYIGHLHLDQDLWRKQTLVLKDVRNMETNEKIE